MSYLVDTCVVSEPTRPRPAASVLAWLKTAEPESLHVSVLTLSEIEKGIERLSKSRKRTELREWADKLRTHWREHTLVVDEPVALVWGRMLAQAEAEGQPIPVVDALLGATAIVHGLTVVTRNTSDIARTGAPILDPWLER